MAPAAALETCLPQNSKNFKNNQRLLFAFCFKRHFFSLCKELSSSSRKVRLPGQLSRAGVAGEGPKPGVRALPGSYHGHCCSPGSKDQVGAVWEVLGTAFLLTSVCSQQALEDSRPGLPCDRLSYTGRKKVGCVSASQHGSRSFHALLLCSSATWNQYL